jgi:hypothetical protein
VVNFSLSESGTGSQVSTSPTTKPAKPPGTGSRKAMCSTSKPIEVKMVDRFSGVGLTGKYVHNQAYEIVILLKLSCKYKAKAVKGVVETREE